MKGGFDINTIDTSLKGVLYRSIQEYLKKYSKNIEILTMDTIHKLFLEINDKKRWEKIEQDKKALRDSIKQYEIKIKEINKKIVNLNFQYNKLINTPRPEDLYEDSNEDSNDDLKKNYLKKK